MFSFSMYLLAMYNALIRRNIRRSQLLMSIGNDTIDVNDKVAIAVAQLIGLSGDSSVACVALGTPSVKRYSLLITSPS